MKPLTHFIRRLVLVFGLLIVNSSPSALSDTTTTKEVLPPPQPVSWLTVSNQWGSFPVAEIISAAQKGEVTAQFYISVAYEDGIGVEKNPAESFKWMKKAAEQNFSKAQRCLGYMYKNGFGAETNATEGFLWIQKAALQGDAGSQTDLGWHYQNGIGVSKNAAESVNWYTKAALQGNSRAQMELGRIYEVGDGVKKNLAEAARLYKLAAEQGHAMAQNNLGWLYLKGLGVPTNSVEAVKWLQKSAEQGEIYGMKNLAWIYSKGMYGPSNTFGQGATAQVKSGGVAPNHQLAEEWMAKAVNLDTAKGQYEYANLIYGEFDDNGFQDTTRFNDAGEWFKKSAEQGYDKAQYKLADMYHTGKLVSTNGTEAIEWFLKAAAQGNTEAQAAVGRLEKTYRDSDLLKSTDLVAILRQSAEKGNLDAQYQLAHRYQTGDGVTKDPVQAFTWMQKVTEHNQRLNTRVSDAMYELALMYERGEGVTQDSTNAQEFFYQAAAGFQPDASYRVGQFYENKTATPESDYQAVKHYYFAFTSLGGGKFKHEAVESLFRLYSLDRGISNPDSSNERYEDRQLKNKASFIKYIQPLIKTTQAQFYVGEFYYRGKIVPKDIVESAAWLEVAANQDLEVAKQMLTQVSLEMSPEQKAQAANRAKALKSLTNPHDMATPAQPAH